MARSSVRARLKRLGSLLQSPQLSRRTETREGDCGSSVVCGNGVPPPASDGLSAQSLLLALNEQSMLLQAALESMDQGLMVLDGEERVLLCNRRAADMLELPHDIMVQRPFLRDLTQYQLSTDELAIAWEEIPRAALELGLRASPQIYERQRPNGTVLETRAVPLMSGGIVLTYTDITARRKAEADLQEREAHHRLLAENATDIITRKDLNGHRTYISPACREVLGYEPEELIGTTPIGNAHPDDRAAVAEGLKL